jgi:type II secretion system protein H
MKLPTRQSWLSASAAFTLIELILVMAILTMAVSMSAPALSNFFRGRSLDSEARRLLALTHAGQSRAVSEGLPIDLWIDEGKQEFGLEAEPSYETTDAHAARFKLDGGLQIEAVKQLAIAKPPVLSPGQTTPSVVSVPPAKLVHPVLPTIRFLPDGTISQSSPAKLRLSGRDGSSLWLVQGSDKLSYEIRSTGN